MSKSFSVDVAKILEDYVGDVEEIVNESAKEAANSCKAQLKNTSPKKEGEYASGWTVKQERSGKLVSFIVHNKTKPQLTHLLENGHVVRNKKGTYGRAHAIKHIQPAEKEAAQEFERLVRAKIGGN